MSSIHRIQRYDGIPRPTGIIPFSTSSSSFSSSSSSSSSFSIDALIGSSTSVQSVIPMDGIKGKRESFLLSNPLPLRPKPFPVPKKNWNKQTDVIANPVTYSSAAPVFFNRHLIHCPTDGHREHFGHPGHPVSHPIPFPPYSPALRTATSSQSMNQWSSYNTSLHSLPHHPPLLHRASILKATAGLPFYATWLMSAAGPAAAAYLNSSTNLTGPDGAFLFPFRKPKRIRTAFSPHQLIELEEAFEKNHYVIGQERKDLASSLNLSETQVKVWFQNRRTKHKRIISDDDSKIVLSGYENDDTGCSSSSSSEAAAAAKSWPSLVRDSEAEYVDVDTLTVVGL